MWSKTVYIWCFHRLDYLVLSSHIRCLWFSTVCLFVCRWFETHHQAEAVGIAGGAGRQVRVAPRRSRMLHWLPYSHAGADSWEESHGRRVPAPSLAHPLVETSSYCTSLPSHSLQRLQQITFQFGHIRWIFISLFVSSFLDFLCSRYWAIASVYVCFVFVGSSLCVMTSGIPWVILLCGHVGSNCCSPFTHLTKQTCYCTASDSSLFVTLLH